MTTTSVKSSSNVGSLSRTKPSTSSSSSKVKTQKSGSAASDRVKVSKESRGSQKSNTSIPDLAAAWGDVKSLQGELNKQGAGLETDGEFGPKTEKAIKEFQAGKGLAATGKLDAETSQRLQEGFRLPEGKLLGNGNAGNDVRAVQNLLNEKGSELKNDGIFGEKTRAAVQKFQEANGLKADGIVGPETMRALQGTQLPPLPRVPAGETKTAPLDLPRLPQPARMPELLPIPALPEARSAAQKASTPAATPVPQKPAATPSLPVPAAPPATSGLPAAVAAATPSRPISGAPAANPESPAQTTPAVRPDLDFLSPQARQALEKSGQLDTLRALPPELTQVYQGFGQQMRDFLGEQIGGSSWGVSHKKRFIAGKPGDFDSLAETIKDGRKKNRYSREDSEAMVKVLPIIQKLSPQQRAAIADMTILNMSKK